jgi:hypothetical protein
LRSLVTFLPRRTSVTFSVGTSTASTSCGEAEPVGLGWIASRTLFSKPE